MIHSLEMDNFYSNQKSLLFTGMLFGTAIFMHQSGVILGINLSIADLFCIVLMGYLIITKQFIIPISPLLCFLVLSILVIVTASFYIPIRFDFSPYPAAIISDYLKLLAIFGYFLLGYNLSNLNFLDKTVQWYSFFGIFIGFVGIVLTFVYTGLFREMLFFAGSRYRGLMLDPNYYSVLQVTALVYFTRVKAIRFNLKYLAITIIILSVLISGSKTGLITLGCYFLLRVLEYLFLTRKKLIVLVSHLMLITFILLLFPVFINIVQQLLNSLAATIPSSGRVYHLFTDFTAAISESGSGREATWVTALKVIQSSPVVGVGIGTYTSLAAELFLYDNVAHNTFLQLSAEWGLPFAIAFFSFVLFALAKATASFNQTSVMNLILRDIIVILLIGSIAISLNNGRMLWLFLGALVYSLRSSPSHKWFVTGGIKEGKGREINASKGIPLFKR
ncbi:O-antigen ligase family protein [Bacillus sp. DJP31]|uniref:O-antigen ligase family protein n=1 Tax=Bacillus sp. DJP31 TaxID=3409789 RepID=UPI003BB69740